MVDTLDHIGDNLPVPQLLLSPGHLHQDEIQLVCQVDEPLIHIGQVDPHIEQNEAHFSPFRQTLDVGALAVDVIQAVQEAGDDNLTAIKLPSREHIFHQHIRVSGLQDGDGGNDTGQPSVSADDGGLTKGRQFQ